MPGTEAGARGEGRHACVRCRVGDHPTLDILQDGAARRIGLAATAELKLATGALEEHDKLGRHLLRDIAAEIFLDQSEGEVEARRHAGRCADPTVPDVERVDLDVDLRE